MRIGSVVRAWWSIGMPFERFFINCDGHDSLKHRVVFNELQFWFVLHLILFFFLLLNLCLTALVA